MAIIIIIINESFRDLFGGIGINSRVADLCSDMIYGATTRRPPSGELWGAGRNQNTEVTMNEHQITQANHGKPLPIIT